jgi:polar amino acid transport system substrate-binding protein
MVAATYIDIMRGVPLLVVMMLMFYVVLAGSGLSPTIVAVISFALVFGAYVSEIFRTAILSIGRGQTEAGVALGFTPLQTFIYIILPQAARAAMPVYKGEAVSLFKNTSIVGYIAIQDLTKASDLIRSRTFDAFFPLIIISIIYFVLAWLLGKMLDKTVKTQES